MSKEKIKELGQKLAATNVEIKKLHGEMEADEAKRTPENREKFEKIFNDGKALKEQIEQLKEMQSIDEFVNVPEGGAKGGDGADALPFKGNRKSWGQAFTESAEFKAARAGNQMVVPAVGVKALYESSDATGGVLLQPDRQATILDRDKVAPQTLLDRMNVIQTTSNMIEFIVVTGFTNNAAEVKEWDSVAANFGLKPESDLAFAEESTAVRTIAHWLRISRNMLDDVPALRGMIDTKLLSGLRRRLEGQIIAGNGTAPNLLGIKNTPGIQTREAGDARSKVTDTNLDTIRRAITDVTLAFGNANVVALNPADAEDLELTKDDNNRYLNVFDPVLQRIWRVPIVETMALVPKNSIVGDWDMGATLFMREEANVRVSENTSDDFIRNALRLLAELRAALAVTDPEMFVDTTLA